jgi:hypothetical protein
VTAVVGVAAEKDPAGDAPFFGVIRVFLVFPDFLATAANRLSNRVSKG